MKVKINKNLIVENIFSDIYHTVRGIKNPRHVDTREFEPKHLEPINPDGHGVDAKDIAGAIAPNTMGAIQNHNNALAQAMEQLHH